MNHRPAQLAAAIAASVIGLHATAQTTFVSIPDFLNIDVGDLRDLDANTTGSDDTGPNSWTPGYQATIDHVLDSVADERPDFVLSAGDLVMGHWHRDVNNRAIFGDTSTLAGQRNAIDAAGDFYYGLWTQRFADRGLTRVYAAVGDHEIGDDTGGNWSGNAAAVIPDYKAEFADHFTGSFTHRPTGPASGTAYAVQRGNILIVTVDPFDHDDTRTSNTVTRRLDAQQQQWLDTTLAAADSDASIEHIIVQGHLPVDDSPTVPQRNSSGLRYQDGGTSSAFWQSMNTHGVDLYLAGEVHDDSARHKPGESVLQVITGGIVGESTTTQYLVGTIDGDITTLAVRDIDLTNVGSSSSTGGLWQTGPNRPHADVAVTNPTALLRTSGGVVIDRSAAAPSFSDAWGAFDELGDRPEVPSASEGNLLQNAGFEANALADNTQEKDFGEVPEWSSSDVDPASRRTGVRNGSGDGDDASTGDNRLYLHNDDGVVFQTIDHLITAGESYELTFFARDVSPAEARVGASIYYLDTASGDRIDMAFGEGELLGDWGRFTLALVADDVAAAALGSPLGVAFDNTAPASAGSESFVQVDHVSLTAVPEPAGGLVLGLISLLLSRRH
jgi:hypothetical protein